MPVGVLFCTLIAIAAGVGIGCCRRLIYRIRSQLAGEVGERGKRKTYSVAGCCLDCCNALGCQDAGPHQHFGDGTHLDALRIWRRGHGIHCRWYYRVAIGFRRRHGFAS